MSIDPEAGFALDPRLDADAVFVADWKLCRVLLMDDARFPWLILVPRRASRSEFDDLGRADQIMLLDEINAACARLRWATQCNKLNVGALGNLVRQLHVHVVARRVDDAAWPGPVWGAGTAQPYAPDGRDALLAALRRDTSAPADGTVRAADG